MYIYILEYNSIEYGPNVYIGYFRGNERKIKRMKKKKKKKCIYRGCVVKTFEKAVGGEGGFNL